MVGPDLAQGYDVAANTNPLGSESFVPTLSNVIDRRQLDDIPLAGRDAYSLLVYSRSGKL